MLRYLNPAKIGLLALLELYTANAVPSDGIMPVLSFLASHMAHDDDAGDGADAPGAWDKVASTARLVSSVHEFERVLGRVPASDRLRGRRLWDRFLETMWGIDSLHALHGFFHSRAQQLAKTKEERRAAGEQSNDDGDDNSIRLTRNSPLGAFVRRSIVEFDKLPFHDIAGLWKAFVQYRQPTMAALRRHNPQQAGLSFDRVLMTAELAWREKTDGVARAAYGDVFPPRHDAAWPAASASDMEDLLDFQISRVQKYGTRVPRRVSDTFRALLEASSPVPALRHYLSFLDAWRAGDYPSSVHCLYRYFDYNTQVRDRRFYQYALMNLAILHADFGCFADALASMLETVSTARESRDMTCLHFALNWLVHFGRSHPTLTSHIEPHKLVGHGRESLAFLRDSASETGMWLLLSSSLLSEAKMGLANGESVAVAVQNAARSAQMIVERNTRIMTSPQLALEMAVWDRLGLASLASQTAEMYLRCHARGSVLEDEVKFSCRLAGQSVLQGRYEAGFGRLEALAARLQRSWRPAQFCRRYVGLLRLRRALHCDHLDAAEHLLAQLAQARADDVEPDMVAVVDMLHVELLTRRGDLGSALARVDQLLGDDNSDIALRIRLLLAKAHLIGLAGRPQRSFTLAVRAASLAWRARLLTLLWQAVGALANILTSLGEFGASADLLLAVLPRSLEGDSVFLAASLFSLLADARIGQAGQAGHTAACLARCTDHLAAAHAALHQALRYFSRVEDVERQCEVLAKMAVVMRAMGDDVLAQDYVDRYLAVRTRAEV